MAAVNIIQPDPGIGDRLSQIIRDMDPGGHMLPTRELAHRLEAMLEAAEMMGGTAEFQPMHFPSVIAYVVTVRVGEQESRRIVVQYISCDNPDAPVDECKEPVSYQVTSYPANAEAPCLIAVVHGGGTLDIWPAEVIAERGREVDDRVPSPPFWAVCLSHDKHQFVQFRGEDPGLIDDSGLHTVACETWWLCPQDCIDL